MLTAAWARSAVGWRSDRVKSSSRRENRSSTVPRHTGPWAVSICLKSPTHLPVGPLGAEIAVQQVRRGPGGAAGSGQAPLAAGLAALQALAGHGGLCDLFDTRQPSARRSASTLKRPVGPLGGVEALLDGGVDVVPAAARRGPGCG